MDSILKQLTDLALGAIPTMAILVFLYVFLQAVFFKPLGKILKERHDATEGSQQQAKLSIEAAERKAAEYSAALDNARSEVHRAREAARQKALAARAELVTKTRETATARIQAARKSIESDVVVAQGSL